MVALLGTVFGLTVGQTLGLPKSHASVVPAATEAMARVATGNIVMTISITTSVYNNYALKFSFRWLMLKKS